MTDKQRILSVTNQLYIETQQRLMNVLKLPYPMYRDFITVYNYYKSSGLGITPSKLITTYNFTDGAYRAMYKRINVLEDKGLIQNINHSYLPTQKAIQLINSITI